MKQYFFKTSLILSLLLLFIPPVLSQTKQKIIFDCDLGSDIDDAFALGLILASPEFEVLGIVMDHGLTDKRAQVAAKMLYLTKREDIPIVVGRKTNQVVGGNTPAEYSGQYYWAEGFSKVKPVSKSAPDFIIETLKKYPGEVILITVGPVTNIGDVLKKDPDALKLAKHVYSMFGSFYAGYGTEEEINPIPTEEWNVRGDSEASKLLVGSNAKITYCGLDVTTRVWFDKDLQFRLLMRQSPLTDALCGLTMLWGGSKPCLHDAVTVGMVLWPDLFTTRPAHVKISGAAYTVIDESKDPNSEVAMTVKTGEFLKRLMNRYMTQSLNDNN
ncbi:MAG TPA: nucleoside hydrolase [Bacteroidales bacterium]|nr:nucleoside hydrolase [Bacteroidales bacterium]